MSALLTTAMTPMRDTVDAFKSAGSRDAVRIGVGGAPATQHFADWVGEDFYAPYAVGAVNRARVMTAT